jgi:hypothetical protein
VALTFETKNRINLFLGLQTYDAKAVCQKGNSPNHKLRSLNNNLVFKKNHMIKNYQQVGLEAAVF